MVWGCAAIANYGRCYSDIGCVYCVANPLQRVVAAIDLNGPHGLYLHPVKLDPPVVVPDTAVPVILLN